MGETDEVALFREMKEVGLDLRDGDGVHYLGAIESMPITRRSTGALLRCRAEFILESDVLATGPTKPQDDEVAACCWCPLDVVCNLDKREPYGGSEMWKDFPCVRLPTPYAFLTLSDRASEKWTIATIRRKFKLWGLTLAIAISFSPALTCYTATGPCTRHLFTRRRRSAAGCNLCTYKLHCYILRNTHQIGKSIYSCM